ncbi:unnamed protein product [Brugia pahangi]|uniref:Uncharacterized protein n=1 Tax=Brugia pahangi TaxID=6280 RepID=A0A0N4TMY6_BRUPA|nr:unnamed protein product [Brugia pahangi]
MPKVVSHPNRQTNMTDGRTDDDGPTDERMGDEWIDKRRNGWMDGWTYVHYFIRTLRLHIPMICAIKVREIREKKEYLKVKLK